MKDNKILDKRLIMCIMAMILILAKMYFLSNIFLLIVIAIISVAIIADKREYKSIYLFFMLPLIYVLKFSNNQVTLYNIFCILYLFAIFYLKIKNNERIDSSPLIIWIFIILLIFINSIFNNQFDFFSSIGWIMNLMTFYLIMQEIKDYKIYSKHVYFFAISIAIVGICGIIFMNNTNIGIYLSNMRRTNTVLTNGTISYRYSGFDLDPNYFALQSLIAFWALFIVNKKNNKYNYILLTTLIIVGLVTVSKMYLITLIVTSIAYLICNFREKRKKSAKKTIAIVVMIIIIGILSSKFILPVFESRLINVKNTEDLTTRKKCNLE